MEKMSTTVECGSARIELKKGDLVEEDVDAIVNAANQSLLGGGGVDGAIHWAAGSDLLVECRKLGGCETGKAKITGGYRLKARHVIHAVGPVYNTANHAELLANAYRSAMTIAAEHNLQSIAFPAISTGVYGYPMDEASLIAISTVCDELASETSVSLVRFVLFSDEAFDSFTSSLQQLMNQRTDLRVNQD